AGAGPDRAEGAEGAASSEPQGAGGPGDDLLEVPGEGPGPALPVGGGLGRGPASLRQPLCYLGQASGAGATAAEMGKATTGRGGQSGRSPPRRWCSARFGFLGPSRETPTAARAGAGPLAAPGRKDSQCIPGGYQR